MSRNELCFPYNKLDCYASTQKVCIKCVASVLHTEKYNSLFWANSNHEYVGNNIKKTPLLISQVKFVIDLNIILLFLVTK